MVYILVLQVVDFEHNPIYAEIEFEPGVAENKEEIRHNVTCQSL